MFLKANRRKKDGKTHIYYTLNETLRIGRRTSQRTLLHLGELSTHEHQRWQKSIDVINEKDECRQMELWDANNAPAKDDIVPVRLSTLYVDNARSFGAPWVGVKAWEALDLDRFWQKHLKEQRGDIPWDKVVEMLSIHRLCCPGSKLSIHETWFKSTAMEFLLDVDTRVASKDRLYRCLDYLPDHKEALEKHLSSRWGELFNADFEVLLYDLTSTYFEGIMDKVPDAKRGYSRDKRSDCKQLVIGLIVSRDGFPLSYEIFSGNTRDVTTLDSAMDQIEGKYGKAHRVWVMDRGIVSEQNLENIRARNGQYLVGAARNKLKDFEKELLEGQWDDVRKEVKVKLCSDPDGDTYIIARSSKRHAKEWGIRHNQLRKCFNALKKLQSQIEKGRLKKYDVLLQRLGRYQERWPKAYPFLETEHKHDDGIISSFTFRLKRQQLRLAGRRDGVYLLRTNLNNCTAKELWSQYIQLTEVESAFRTIKSDIRIRPIYHWTTKRIEAHIMLVFMGYAMWVYLKHKLNQVAPSLTPAQLMKSVSSIQMVDVWFDTADQRRICLPRITRPDSVQKTLLTLLHWHLPEQPPPRIYQQNTTGEKCVGDSRYFS